MEKANWKCIGLGITLLLAFLALGCENPFSKKEKSQVKLHFGNAVTRSVSPSDTAAFRLLVSGSGMDPINRSVEASTNSFSLTLPAGKDRHFTLHAVSAPLYGTTQVLYKDSLVKSLPAGKTVSISFSMEAAADTVPPVYPEGDLTFANVTETGLDISWPAAADHFTKAASITYSIYQSASNNISTPADCAANGTALSTLTGTTAFSVSSLSTGSTYTFNVVAEDEAGNQAAYTAVSVTTSSAPLILPQTDPYGYYLAGDGSGGGGAGDYGTNYSNTGPGGDGGGDDDSLAGTSGNDVIFGDGSGGGGGGVPYTVSSGGAGGSGNDYLLGGPGRRIERGRPGWRRFGWTR